MNNFSIFKDSNRFYLLLFLSSISLLNPVNCLSKRGYSKKEEPKGLKDCKGNQMLSLPINATLAPGKRVHLMVVTPQNFICCENNWFTTGNGMYRATYVPAMQSAQSWTARFEVTLNLNKRISAVQDQAELKKTFAARPMKIIEEYTKKYDGYIQAYIAFICTNGDTKTLIVDSAYSGPFDSAALNCIVRLNDEMTEEIAYKQIKEFLSNQTKIITDI